MTCPKGTLASRLDSDREEAARKAIDALARYKFWMFGYWAAAWVRLNRQCETRKPSPFKHIVEAARRGEQGERRAAS